MSDRGDEPSLAEGDPTNVASNPSVETPEPPTESVDTGLIPPQENDPELVPDDAGKDPSAVDERPLDEVPNEGSALPDNTNALNDSDVGNSLPVDQPDTSTAITSDARDPIASDTPNFEQYATPASPTTRGDSGPGQADEHAQAAGIQTDSGATAAIPRSDIPDTEPTNDTSFAIEESPSSDEPYFDGIKLSSLPPLPSSQTLRSRPSSRPSTAQRQSLQASNSEAYSHEDLQTQSKWASSRGEAHEEEPVDVDDNPAGRTVRIRTESDQETAEEDEEPEEDTALMDPDDPLMKRVQDALQKQLTEQLTKLRYDLKEKEEAVRAAVTKRETIGVELYSLQQQLARHQAISEGTADNLILIKQYREEAERKLRHTTSQWKEQKERADQHAKNLGQHKQELEKISRTIKQVDLYNEELRSKIMVAKRTTMKAEEDLIKQEHDKKRQDYFIDHLTDQLRKLQERRALYETQLLAQQKETHSAMETLQDAATEMEAIQFEKRQLLHQWKSSLIGLQRREDILQQVETGIQKNKDTILNMTGEISGFRYSLRQAQEQNETLTVLLNKLEGEVEYIKREIADINEQKEKLKESWTIYTKSLQQTESELTNVLLERQALNLELSAVQKQTQATAVATQKLQSEIAEHLQNQLSISKGQQGTRKDNTLLRQQIHEKEATIAQVQNDLSHIRLDMLNANGRLRGMKDNLTKLDKNLLERNSVIEKYEVEIRRRNDELGKKQSEIDLLNKKYDQLQAKNLDESVGPLEATIHNLSKLIQAKEKECSQLSQFWLRSQNELVGMTKRTAEISDQTQDLRMRLTVLSRKKMVVNNAFETELKEIREHQRNIRQLQNDMVKVNTLLTQQAVSQNRLEENNLGLEQEFRAKLKNAELESIHLEQNLEDLKTEKQRALQGLIEAERQMMLWEKKIQLARETQAALDPNIGATEIKEMQAEIHRMKLRYASMLKLQEKMISEMEKSVYRRESIAARTKTKGKGGNHASLQKAIADLAKKLRTTMNDLRECDDDINALKGSNDTMVNQLQQASHSINELDARETELLSEIEAEMQKKELLSNTALLQQKQARRYRDLASGKYTFLIRDAEQREDERNRLRERLAKIGNVVEIIEVRFCHVYCNNRSLPITQTEYGASIKSHFEPIHQLISSKLAAR
ncbi:hypothetical protein DFS34DRAFT_704117 [Phlyctochytrium arcticum]|nr:hypothetical protein DFS34DRAFT_704117 [Phlyctochytrium arcticum]